MLDCVVHQYADDLIAYEKDIEYLKVKRHFNLSGRLVSTFFQEGKIILETGYLIFLFRKFLSINYQDLPAVVTLEKVKGNYILNYDDNFLLVKRRYFKNPLYQLYSNNNLQGNVNTKVNGFTEIPIVYKIHFENDKDVNFYLLLLFLINLPPTMDV